jgi:GTP-binding protein HflX
VVGSEITSVNNISNSHLLGSGTVDRLGQFIDDQDIDLVILNHDVTPVQQRNLEKDWQAKVLDRTALILEIFGERAQTAEGKLQVELAHLTYQRSRLVRTWTHLERQRGGYGFVGGPGETQIEIDRRLINDRIARLKDELEKVKKTRRLQRKSRSQVPYPIIALVGYTNAGKSTLFNQLTEGEVSAKDQLFETLDPTMRAVELPSGRRVILSDTVGFIANLPTQLVAAFRATLEEVNEADIICHVQDIASDQHTDEKQDVLDVLEEMEVKQSDDSILIDVLNKIDLLDAERRKYALNKSSNTAETVAISALTGDRLTDLLDEFDVILDRKTDERTYQINIADGEAQSWLYEHVHVLDRVDTPDHVYITVRITPDDHGRFMSHFDHEVVDHPPKNQTDITDQNESQGQATVDSDMSQAAE